MTTGRFGWKPDTQQENDSLEVWLDPQTWKSIVALNGTDWTILGVTATTLTGGATYAVELGIEGTIGLVAFSKALPCMTVALSTTGAS